MPRSSTSKGTRKTIIAQQLTNIKKSFRRLTVHMHQPDGRTEFDFFGDVFGEKGDLEGKLSLGWRWIDLSSPTYAGVAC